MEFDKNDMVIIQEIKKVIKHEENHDRLLEPPPIIRKMNPKQRLSSLINFFFASSYENSDISQFLKLDM